MNVTEELVDFEDRIDLAHVERRIEDWRHRIDRLYGMVSAWLPPPWSTSTNGKVAWHDPLFDRFDVSEQFLPVLEIEKATFVKGRLKPRALWILGANGRIDLALIPPTKHFIVADRADLFDPPRWRIYDSLSRQDSALTRESLLACFA